MIKNFKKLSLILSAILLTGCAEEALSQLGFSEVPAERNVQVNSAKKEDSGCDIYDSFIESLGNTESVSYYDEIISVDNVKKAIERLRNEHPEYFWIDSYTISTSSGKSELKIDVLNDYSEDELGNMLNEIETCADDIISQIPEWFDDYDAVVFVHDYIVNNTTYDSAHTEVSYNGLWGTAYGCLIEGNAICQGYAEAFQYLMNRLGIESGICRGETVRGRHAWNYVKINEQYYWIDVTWDDPVPENEGEEEKLIHTYCLVNDDLMLKTRYTDSDLSFVPKCVSMDSNYFVQSGTYVPYYNEELIRQILENNAANGEVEIMFADSNSYKEAKKRLFDEGGIWNYVNSEMIHYSDDEVMYVMKINY